MTSVRNSFTLSPSAATKANGSTATRKTLSKLSSYMRKYTTLHGVRIHGRCLLHNHGHWIFEASTPDFISNVMRDMQSRYSHYLNVKYRETPWVMIAPLFGVKHLAYVPGIIYLIH